MRCDLVRINIYRKISIMYQIYNIVIKKKKIGHIKYANYK